MKMSSAEVVDKMSEIMALLYYHLTKGIVEELGEEKGEQLIRRCVENFGLERGSNIAGRVIEAGKPLSIGNLDAYYDLPIDLEGGWAINNSFETNRKTEVVDTCKFADVWKAKNWDRIGAVYCLVDFAIRRGYNPDLIFEVEENLMCGDQRCVSITKEKER